MIITILGIILLIIGIKLLSMDIRNNYENVLFLCGVVAFGIGAIITFMCTVCIIGVQTGKEVNYQNALYEKEVLEYRIENMENDITGNEMLYNDIVEFNNELRNTKKWANNPWSSWFWNEDIATIDYVEYR